MKTLNKVWTYEDYYGLSDDKRYEILEGELIEMAPAPHFKHQTILVKLLTRLYAYAEDRKIGLVRCAPVDVRLDKYNCVQPDIIYISKENFSIIDERGVFGSPDLLVEILSPFNADHDKKKKFKLYEKFGVKEYWIVDPEKREIEVYSLVGDQYEVFTKGASVKSNLLADFHVEFSELED